MNNYHLFSTTIIKQSLSRMPPKALDAAPHDRMTIRKGLADALTADFWLRANGGVAV